MAQHVSPLPAAPTPCIRMAALPLTQLPARVPGEAAEDGMPPPRTLPAHETPGPAAPGFSPAQPGPA